jgi:histidine ammonia-lyase
MIAPVDRVILTGAGLTLAELLAVARGGAQVEIAPEALAAMARARDVADRALAEGRPTYGVSTGVGSRKLFDIARSDHDRLLVRQHRMSQGKPVPHEVVRGSTLRLANALTRATTVARPGLAELLVTALNDDRLPVVRAHGSIGQSDLAQMADLADGILDEYDFDLVQGEAITLLNQSAFATAYGALAFADAKVLLDVLDYAGALDLEGLAGNRYSVHPAVGVARPYPGLQATLARVGGLLEGSEVESRNLQDPLTFRTICQQNGACRDAFGFVEQQLAIELNAAQSNPLVVVEEDRVFSVGNFEMQPLATALDVARLALAPTISTAAERAVKLLQQNLTGLTHGLGAKPDLPESALSEYGIAIQAIAVEARLLAQPVSFDLVSTTQAEGIEDRMTMAPLAGRRLAEMVELGARVVAVELMHAAQACDLRGQKLGVGTARLHAAVRRFVPFLDEGDALPDLEPLVEEIRSGRIIS